MIGTLLCTIMVQAAAVSGSIDALGWMSGAWGGRSGEMDMEELWLAPKGGLMLGVHRDIKGGKTVNYELLRIEMKDGTLVYTSIPNGQNSTPFRLKSLQDKKAIFENPAHDFPQRILYWSPRDGELCARIEGKQGGEVVGEEWCWRRSK